MKMYLIIDERHSLISYADKWKLFLDRDEAITHLVSLGWEFGGFYLSREELSDTIGTTFIQQEGKAKVTFIPIEVLEVANSQLTKSINSTNIRQQLGEN